MISWFPTLPNCGLETGQPPHVVGGDRNKLWPPVNACLPTLLYHQVFLTLQEKIQRGDFGADGQFNWYIRREGPFVGTLVKKMQESDGRSPVRDRSGHDPATRPEASGFAGDSPISM